MICKPVERVEEYMSASASRLPLVLSLVAIVLGGGLAATIYGYQGTVNSLNDKLNTLNNQMNTVQSAKTQNLNVWISMGGITDTSNSTQDTLASLENHRFEPSVLAVHVGDTVNLNVTNMDDHNHSLVMVAFGVDTGKLVMGQSVVKSFVANKAGVFQFKCGVPYFPPDDCAPDHSTVDGSESITGYLVVTA